MVLGRFGVPQIHKFKNLLLETNVWYNDNENKYYYI